ncbi:Signal recognition particle, subunit Srp14 [Phaffia rhodozyma]|uniref:Signal recognition particle subunit SRP14 n=1 Tax=Phaffia rhodozyma TaxID=264483 RepID=A0A0F7SVL0_PHARH|nr:Signal recognition particle, subunit Srp14 [Phaffia rhodozyma]
MPTDVVSNEEFLVKLQSLLGTTEKAGSVWITQKRLTWQDPSVMETVEEDESKRTWSCAIKASDGKTKFTTHVPSTSLDTFSTSYGTLLKASFAPHLRKRDKKKEKSKAEILVRERKRLEVVVQKGLPDETGKRGKGRGRHQRKVKALRKAEAALSKIVGKEERKKQGDAAVADLLVGVSPSS